MRITFKAKHADGARYTGSESVQYIGKSRIDDFPMFSYETEDEVNLFTVWKEFVFNGRPGYTPRISDFEFVPSIEEPFAPKKGIVERYSGKSTITVGDIIPVQPMELPTGGLYYLDYIYETELDNRLLFLNC